MPAALRSRQDACGANGESAAPSAADLVLHFQDNMAIAIASCLTESCDAVAGRPVQPAATAIRRGLHSSVLGRWSARTPSFTSAVMALASTPSPIRNAR